MARHTTPDVKPDAPPEKGVVCDICGKKTTQPYGYTRHGNGCVCSKTCHQKYEEFIVGRMRRKP